MSGSNGTTFDNDKLTIGGVTFESRLMLGTGKYRDSAEMNAAFSAAGSQIITVALRRIDFDDPKSRSVL
ncbi:MAG: thiazole synthase, partial [Thermomicrobiales bacterium]|nr:thiazole synthase [Thermomicrobiales bacterium]